MLIWGGGIDLIILVDCGVDRGSNAIPVYPISAKLPECLIREAEETLENNIRGP